MTFAHAWILGFSVLPVAWCAWMWSRSALKTSLLLKTLSLLGVVLALSSPQLNFSTTRMAVAVLADTSASVSDADLTRSSQLGAAIVEARGRNWSRVIPFARSLRTVQPQEIAAGLRLQHTPGEAGLATDFESALRDALAAMPTGLVPRIALISDGKENRGSVARAVAVLQQLRVPVDTFALAGRSAPQLTIESVTMPAVAFTGEKFAIDLTVRSPHRCAGVIELAAEGKSLGSSPVTFEAGMNQLRVHASVSEPGAIGMTGTIRVQGLEDALFSQALALRRPKLLFISSDPPGADDDLLNALRAAQFEIDASREALTPQLDNNQIVVLNNWDLQALPAAREQELQDYVKQGGGLLVIGGERNIYLDTKRTGEDPLERALPAKIAPPRSPEARCVVLLIDKSSSMEGRKMELAQLSAVGIIQNLRSTDLIGILMFDHAFQWLVPISPIEDREKLVQLISGIVANGGTQIPLALAEAYSKIVPVQAGYKHMVLLTDGVSEEGDSYRIAKEAGSQNITISTIGLGSYVYRQFLDLVANYSRGRSYFLDDPANLEQILLRDVMEHTGTTVVEKNVTPVVLQKVELLEDVQMESAPQLAGYVRYIAKPTAEVIMSVDDKQPLLARWQYGLGRSIVFTSDAKSRWASGWMKWAGFDKLWSNIARDLLPHAQAEEANVAYDSANGDLVVDYHLGPNVPAPPVIPDIFVLGPEGFQEPINVAKIAEGSYRGRVAVGDLQGLFRVRPLEESRAFPEAGLYRAVDEVRTVGNDEPLLRRIAESTAGRFNPAPRAVFNPGGRSAASTLQLWSVFLALAVLLNLAELVVRKWRGVVEGLKRSDSPAALQQTTQ